MLFSTDKGEVVSTGHYFVIRVSRHNYELVVSSKLSIRRSHANTTLAGSLDSPELT